MNNRLLQPVSSCLAVSRVRVRTRSTVKPQPAFLMFMEG